MTAKQISLAKAVVANPDATLSELSEKAVYANASAVHRALNSPNVKARIAEMMERRPNLKRDALLGKLEDGLEAKETKFFQHEGEVVETRECIDYSTRRGYLEMAFKLNGDLAQSQDVASAGGDKFQLAVIIMQERVKRGLEAI